MRVPQIGAALLDEVQLPDVGEHDRGPTRAKGLVARSSPCGS